MTHGDLGLDGAVCGFSLDDAWLPLFAFGSLFSSLSSSSPSSSQLLDFWLYQLHQSKRKEERENWTK